MKIGQNLQMDITSFFVQILLELKMAVVLW